MRSSPDETRRHPCAAVESRFCCAFLSAVARDVRRGRSVIALGSLLHAECSWSTGVVTAKILQDSTAAGFCIDGSHLLFLEKSKRREWPRNDCMLTVVVFAMYVS